MVSGDDGMSCRWGVGGEGQVTAGLMRGGNRCVGEGRRESHLEERWRVCGAQAWEKWAEAGDGEQCGGLVMPVLGSWCRLGDTFHIKFLPNLLPPPASRLDPPSAAVGILGAGCILPAKAAIMLPHMAASISRWGTPSLLLIRTV